MGLNTAPYNPFREVIHMASSFVKTMTSFSGADLIVNFGPKVIGELQQISWAVK